MRLSKRNCVLILSLIMILMTGCGSAMQEVTDEQMNLIGEYAAVQLLKYVANSRSRLVDSELMEKEEKRQAAWEAAREKKPASTPKPEGMGAVDDTPVVGVGTIENQGIATLEEYYDLPQGLSLTYSGYQVCESYPQEGEEGVFSLDASEGKKLLVLSFRIENATENDQAVDLFSKAGQQKITVNGDYIRNALTTMLLNDISTYENTLSANSGEELVLLVEVEQAVTNNIASIVVNFKNESKAFTIQAL